jgi:hypothetical protein
MARKLVIALALPVVIGLTIGCKDDKPTRSSNVDMKAQYSGQQQYKQQPTGSTDSSKTPE